MIFFNSKNINLIGDLHYFYFKELIQNADDAGATEIAFILDCRDLNKQKTGVNCFKKLLEPSLLCWNNRPFSSDDLEGIKKLGIGSKRENSFKIGRHGLGVNSMYHLTDAPQVITNDSIYFMFDPMLLYLPNLKKEKPFLKVPNGPGIKIDNINNYCQPKDTRLNDLKSGFHVPGFELKGSTMFRMAWRTELSQKNSRISDVTFTIEKIKALMDKYIENESDLLLFTKNVLI